MSRPNSIPKLTLHRASGKAVVRLSGVAVYCGIFGTSDAKVAYDRAVAEWLARGRAQDVRPEPAASPGLSVNELLLAFVKHADQHYRRPDGTPTNEINEYRQTLRVVQDHYGLTPAAEFGPIALKAVRQAMINRGWCRGLVNQRVNRVRRVFKWGAGDELISFDVFQRLATVTGLQKGRCAAPESEPIVPVADEVVEATLSCLNRFVRGMVEFQRLTGCRPGEACGVRRGDIDMGGAVWLYRPNQHKTAWRGKPRVITIGPRAQTILRTVDLSSVGITVGWPDSSIWESSDRTQSSSFP